MSGTDEKPWKQYPMLLEEAVEEVLLHMSEGTKRRVANSPKYLLSSFNLGLGLTIKNGLGLSTQFPDSNLADAELFKIMEGVWESLQKDRRYKDVLRNPETGDELPEELRNVNLTQYTERKFFYDNLAREFHPPEAW